MVNFFGVDRDDDNDVGRTDNNRRKDRQIFLRNYHLSTEKEFSKLSACYLTAPKNEIGALVHYFPELAFGVNALFFYSWLPVAHL